MPLYSAPPWRLSLFGFFRGAAASGAVYEAPKCLICPQPAPVFPSGHRVSPWLPTPGAIFGDVSGHHNGAMLATVSRRWMRSKMAANSLRGTVTSASQVPPGHNPCRSTSTAQSRCRQSRPCRTYSRQSHPSPPQHRRPFRRLGVSQGAQNSLCRGRESRAG